MRLFSILAAKTPKATMQPRPSVCPRMPAATLPRMATALETSEQSVAPTSMIGKCGASHVAARPESSASGEKDEAARVVSRHIENQAQAVADVIRTKKN